jgi:CBS domain-containing membrane protein
MSWNPRILEGYKRRAAYTCVWTFVSMIVIGFVAALTEHPYLFPSLGPTAIMLFAHPLRKDSSPRHILIGHGIGAASGYFALALTGLLSVPFSAGISSHRVLAAAIALGLTAGIMTLTKSEHAPAGATTLIVALGIMPTLADFLFLMAAVAALTAIGFAVSRACGIAYPLWAATNVPARHS